jgi:hypothetical protein
MGINEKDKQTNANIKGGFLNFLFEVPFKAFLLFIVEIISRYIYFSSRHKRLTIRQELLIKACCHVTDKKKNRHLSYIYPKMASAFCLFLSNDNAHDTLFNEIMDEYYKTLSKTNLIKNHERNHHK